MSEIVTWSVKIDDETKQDIQQLLNNSGQQGKDFVQTLVTAYKINKVKESNPDAKVDIEELQYHTSRVNEIYYNLTSRVASNIKNIIRQHDERLDAKQLEIDMLKEEKVKLKEELINSNNCKQAIEQTHQEQIKKFDDLGASKAVLEDLNHQYKDKIETLSELVIEYKQFKEDIETLNMELSKRETKSKELEIKSNELEGQLKELASQLRQSQDQVATSVLKANELQLKNETDIKELQEKYKEELQLWNDKLALKYDKEAVKKLQESQEQLQLVRDEYNEKVKVLLQQMQQAQIPSPISTTVVEP